MFSNARTNVSCHRSSAIVRSHIILLIRFNTALPCRWASKPNASRSPALARSIKVQSSTSGGPGDLYPALLLGVCSGKVCPFFLRLSSTHVTLNFVEDNVPLEGKFLSFTNAGCRATQRHSPGCDPDPHSAGPH